MVQQSDEIAIPAFGIFVDKPCENGALVPTSNVEGLIVGYISRPANSVRSL